MEPILILGLAVIVIVIVIVGLLATKRRPHDDAADVLQKESAGPVVADDLDSSAPGAVETESAPPVLAPEAPVRDAPEVPRAKRSITERFTEGLRTTSRAIGDRLAIISRREKLEDEDFDEIEEALLRADVGVKASTKIVDSLRDSGVLPADLQDALRSEVKKILMKGDRVLKVASVGPSVWLVTGVNGVGKTTTIAKLAHRLKAEGRTVVLAAADTFRAAAIDQLGTWADRVDVHMVRHDPGADPGAVVFDAIEHAKAKGIDVVIVDTAGRLHTKTNLMEELKKVKRIADRGSGGVAEVLLVLDATVGQNGISQARIFQEAVEVTGVVLTKLDGTARGGIVIAVQEELGIPVKAVGLGETLEDLEPFDPERFTEALIRSA